MSAVAINLFAHATQREHILGPAFCGRQPTECLKERVVGQPLARRGFELKVRAFLRHKSFLHIVSLHPAVCKWIVSLDKYRGTTVIQDWSSYEVCKNEIY